MRCGGLADDPGRGRQYERIAGIVLLHADIARGRSQGEGALGRARLPELRGRTVRLDAEAEAARGAENEAGEQQEERDRPSSRLFLRLVPHAPAPQPLLHSITDMGRPARNAIAGAVNNDCERV
jgi:hypothetical protein